MESPKMERETQAQDEVISQFPPVEDNEITKHRLLNEEAERNKALNAGNDSDSYYLKRLKLKLERKILREKELKMKKRLEMLQKQRMMQIKPKPVETKDEFFVYKPTPAPPPPPKPKAIENHMKTVLGFRYSHAVEEYYRGQLTHLGHLRLALLSELNYKDEVVNGCFTKNMGANVLNLKARTLPSCNPVEIRLRRRHAKLTSREKEPSFLSMHKTFSRESTASKVLERSHDSLTKLKAESVVSGTAYSPEHGSKLFRSSISNERKDTSHEKEEAWCR